MKRIILVGLIVILGASLFAAGSRNKVMLIIPLTK